MKNVGLAIDIDDTLAETAKTCIEKTVKRFGHPQHFSAKKLVSLYEQPGKVPEWDTPQVQEYIASLLKDPDFLFSVPPLTYAQEGLRHIQKQMPIGIYISSRFEEARDSTIAWLQKYSFPNAPVVLRQSQTINPQWKIKYLAEHFPQCSGLIDDTASAFSINQKNVPFHLYWLNRYHHSHAVSSLVHSFSSWKELTDHFTKKETDTI